MIGMQHCAMLRFDRPQRAMDFTDRDELDFFAMCSDPRSKSLGKKDVYALNLIALFYFQGLKYKRRTGKCGLQ